MRLAYQTNTWGGVVGHPVGVTSIKDLYYLATGSTAQAMREVSQAGYDGVELFDGNLVQYEDSPGEFLDLLDQHSLRLVAVYSGANFIFPEILDQELWRIDRAAWLGARWGAQHLVVGGGAQTLSAPGEPEYKRLGSALDRVREIGERHGLTASFHPHLTTIVETAEHVDRLLPYTSISLCPDTGHVLLAGDDPAQWIRTHADRIAYVHLKDVDVRSGAFVPLGAGSLDLRAVMKTLAEIGYDGWVTVELDAWHDPADGARINRGALERWIPIRAVEGR